MGLAERTELYKQIEAHRKHPLLVYVTSKRDGAVAPMASPIIELLNSGEAGKLLSPVPQLDLPMNAPGPSMVGGDMTQLENLAKNSVQPVPFAHVGAIIESVRLSYRGVVRGQILASRMPDLNVQFNALVTSKSWEKCT